MRALAVVVLAGCASLPTPNSALNARDRMEVERIHALWLEHGLPDPAEHCDIDAFTVVYPADAETIYRKCKGRACGTPTTPKCIDGCYVRLYDGFLTDWLGGRKHVAIVSGRTNRLAWRHEIGHYWEWCTGLPPSHGQEASPEQEERFNAWLREVEKR